MSKKAMLLIMDGWGHGQVPSVSAISNAKAPFVHSLYERYPNTELITCGEAVGLPDGQMGNSEVGHLNLGAGRIVYQELQRINVAIRNNELAQNNVLNAAFNTAKSTGKTVHFIGLVSNGGVHSHTSHLKALVDLAAKAGVPKIAVHAFTDGRDTDPKSGYQYLEDLQQHLKESGAFLASIIGRYYAMDRDKRWERVKLAYDLLVRGTGTATQNALAAVQESYNAGVTDEFIKPIIVCDNEGKPLSVIAEEDIVICFNFRTDRCREITEVLTQQAFPEQGMGPLKLHYVTMTEYDASFKNIGVVFHNDNLVNTIGEVLAANGKKQIRIAETEKYPHVTFFFSGGREVPFEGERRIMCPSPKDVATYDLKPEMSAREITEAILPELEQETADFICLNFANADMVGHTGVWEAAIKAVETVDECVSRIVPMALEHGYAVFLTADHGNADYMQNPDGSPNTAHTLNPVPLFLISNDYKGALQPGKLGDIAPTILAYMGITIPAEMTGTILIQPLASEGSALSRRLQPFMPVFFWILAALTTAATGYFIYRADARRKVPYPWLSALLRTLLVALVWLLLLAPSITINKQETQNPVVVFLQDESASIPVALKGDTATYAKESQELLNKLKAKFRVVTWGFGGNIQSDSLFNYKQPATDIAGALAQVQEFYGQQNLGAVVMASDGRFNQGIHPLFQNLALRSPVYTIALGDTATAKDLRIARVYANRTAALNSQFELRADLLGLGCSGYNGNVQLSEGNTTLQSIPLTINNDHFDRAVSFTVKAASAGLHHYTLLVPPAPGEQNTANNRREVFVQVVSEKKSILILAAAPHPDVNALREALAGLETYNVTIRTIDAMPASLAEYQVVILHGLPTNAANVPALTGKPVWYILTSSSSNAINTTAGNISINAGAQRDAYATANSSFSSFALPQRIAAVADRLPPLSIPVGTITAGANTQVLFNQKSSQFPLWMLQSGNVPQAVLAGEGLWRWRLYEYRYFHNHDVIDECIRQTVASLAANVNENPFRVEQPKYEWSDGENISLNAYLLNASNEQINTPEAGLTIRDSLGKVQNFSFERSSNTYRLNIGIQPGGTYNYTAKTVYNGKAYSATGSFVVAGMPVELMETSADYPLLYGVAKKYNGAAFTRANMQAVYDSISKNENIRPLIQTSEESLPLVDWKWYFFLLLALAAADWLLRKYWLAQ